MKRDFMDRKDDLCNKDTDSKNMSLRLSWRWLKDPRIIKNQLINRLRIKILDGVEIDDEAYFGLQDSSLGRGGDHAWAVHKNITGLTDELGTRGARWGPGGAHEIRWRKDWDSEVKN